MLTDNPAALMGLWLKDHPHSDQAHRILRQEGKSLVGICGIVFPVRDAAEVKFGVRHCLVCKQRERGLRSARRQKNEHKI